MAGRNNSVSSRLTAKVPHLVTAKCICHSLHLVCDHASKLLPDHLDTMVRETYNYFAHSTKRNDKYVELYTAMGEGRPKKIPQLAKTRWLSRENATKTILDQWDCLKLFFQVASDQNKNDFSAAQLSAMYNSYSNKLFLIFLRDSLKHTVNLNKLFQSEAVEALKLFEDLNDLLYTTLQKIVVLTQLQKVNRRNLDTFKFSEYLISSDCINFGYDFNLASRNLDQEKLRGIKSQCKLFLNHMCIELQMRLPANIDILEQISVFTPQDSMQRKRDITDIVVQFREIVDDVDAALAEWQCLLSGVFPAESESTEDYWNRVEKMKKAGGERRYGHISRLVLALLALPFSNASVERAFSLVNIVKDKLRNRMAVKSCEAVLRIRYCIDNPGDFELTESLLKAFNSEEVYCSQFDDDVLNVFGDIH